jgi:hypothetical protein
MVMGESEADVGAGGDGMSETETVSERTARRWLRTPGHQRTVCHFGASRGARDEWVSS